MKAWMILLIPALAAAADSPALDRLFDTKLPSALRANACFELRGTSDPEVTRAMSRAIEDPDLLTCAADNLRIAGAAGALSEALAGSKNPQVRAAAARELGSFQKPEFVEQLNLAARDENALVATNALRGLSQYESTAVVPALASLAAIGGMAGDMALERLAQLDSQTALETARVLLAGGGIPDQLYAMRTIGAFGGTADLPALRKIATSGTENLSQNGRGFGFMPAINLGRAAQAAIAAIESRQSSR